MSEGFIGGRATTVAEAVDAARGIVAGAERVVVLAGAGMSTSSGIPDFRGAAGLWTADPDNEKISTLSWYLGDDDVRRKAWQYRAGSPVWEAIPNDAHRAIVELERRGVLAAVVTQNTDGLQQLAGTDPSLVLEVHGSVQTCRCESCGDEQPMVDVVRRVRNGEDDPRCEALVGCDVASECGGILRATTILFEESLPGDVLDAAIEATSGADVFLALGSTLSVFPVAGLVPLAKRCGAKLVIANLDETSYDVIADVVIRDDLAKALPAVVG